MWSNPTLRKLNAEKKPALTLEEEALPKMQKFLEDYGLQITLKTLADSLDKWIKNHAPYTELCVIVETIRGLHTGYCRRHEEEEAKDGH